MDTFSLFLSFLVKIETRQRPSIACLLPFRSPCLEKSTFSFLFFSFFLSFFLEGGGGGFRVVVYSHPTCITPGNRLSESLLTLK